MLKYINIIPCECGSRKQHEEARAFVADHVVSERSVVCDACGKEVNYWAYGHYQFPLTYTELILNWLRCAP